MYLQGIYSGEEVEEFPLADPDSIPLCLPSALMGTASRGLRRRIAGGNEILDPAATIRATIRRNGVLTPRYGWLHRTPEYVALIDRRTAVDHQAFFQTALLRSLAEYGVVLRIFYFEVSPEYGCWHQGQADSSDVIRGHCHIAGLVSRYVGQRLLIFADAYAALDPISGRAAAWTRHLEVFPQRAWFTPIPLPSWGGVEGIVDELGFLVLPAQPEALMTLADWLASERAVVTPAADWPSVFPGRLRTDDVGWVARQIPPPKADLDDLLYELRNYLGALRFQWLCACAVFPALSPPLTLALGHVLTEDDRELGLGLMALGALPWFRYGHLPAWLREALLDCLNPANEVLFRREAEERLAGAVLGTAGSPLVTLSIRRRWWAWFHRQGKPMRDRVLVSFLYRNQVSRLVQRLPDALKKRLFRRGHPWYGLRLGIPATAAVLMLASLMALPGVWEHIIGSDDGSLIPLMAIPANPEMFGVIEIGGKGVKGVVVDLAIALTDENCKKDQEVFSDCLLRKKFDPYNVSPLVKAPIGDTAKAVKTIMDEMTKRFTVDPSQIYVVGSSSVNAVEHKLGLKKAIEETLGNSIQMDFVHADHEGAYAFQGVVALIPDTWGKNTQWRDKRQKEVVVLDIGSGNSKGGYMEVVGDEKRFVSFEMKYGTKSFSDMASKQGGNFKEASARLRKTELQPAIREIIARNPDILDRDHIYLLGGISWALTNLIQPRNILPFPPVYPAHFDTLYARAIAPDAEKRLCSQNQDRDINKDIQRACDIFTIKDMIAGMDLMKAFSQEMGFKNKHIFFARDSLYAWPLGYLKARCESEGKC